MSTSSSGVDLLGAASEEGMGASTSSFFFLRLFGAAGAVGSLGPAAAAAPRLPLPRFFRPSVFSLSKLIVPPAEGSGMPSTISVRKSSRGSVSTACFLCYICNEMKSKFRSQHRGGLDLEAGYGRTYRWYGSTFFDPRSVVTLLDASTIMPRNSSSAFAIVITYK